MLILLNCVSHSYIMDLLTQGKIMNCAFDGCERKSVSKGYCDKHYRRILKRGDVNDYGSRKVDDGNAIERFQKNMKFLSLVVGFGLVAKDLMEKVFYIQGIGLMMESQSVRIGFRLN